MKKDSLLTQNSYQDFEKLILEYFGFLEADNRYKYKGIREINNGLNDQGVVAVYDHDHNNKVEIGWSAPEKSLSLLIKIDIESLSRLEKYIYFEPFLEFYSKGKIEPIIPQIYPGVGINNIEKAFENRIKILDNGLERVIKLMAERFRQNFDLIESLTQEKIKEYHSWYLNRGRAK